MMRVGFLALAVDVWMSQSLLLFLEACVAIAEG
jgi:hypothetical protein